MTRYRPLSAVLVLAAAWAGPGSGVAQETDLATAMEIPEVEHHRYVLENGLTLVVHEDRKAPIVAVNVWYHVGSKNERPGRTGFAHLFEHLMFNGSENYDDDYFGPFERVGVTDMNGTTNPDRTNYFQNVPTTALDLALWMESDRMGNLLGAIDQAKLDEQRGVVQNEKRQGENQPYGLVREIMAESTYPSGHPYSWTTIGSMEDLDAASLEDVREWFLTYYGASNATVVIAGNVDPEHARDRVEHFFGSVPPGPPVTHPETWVAPMGEPRRHVARDRVPQARIYKTWNIPSWGTREGELLDLVSDVLGSGRTSRLYRRLVYEEQIATQVSASASLREIGGQFQVQATARPGQDLAEVEQAIDEELERLLEEGPTAAEMERVKTERFASFIRGIERIGGFGGKSDVLAACQVYVGDPDCYRDHLRWVRDATAADLQRVAARWLDEAVFVLEVHPHPDYTAAASTVDRSALPEVTEFPDVGFPSFTTSTLANGLEIVLAERRDVPVVNFTLMVDAGYAADQHSTPGTASLTAAMLDQGTENRTALEIAEEASRLGARIASGASVDVSTVSLDALRHNLEGSVELFADVVRNPSFPESDFRRLQQERLAQIQREKVTPVQMALRVMPPLLYGADHAYGQPLTGSGTEEAVRRLEPADLVSFHDTWYRADNATLVVVGDVSMSEVRPLLERHFGSWRAGGVPTKEIDRALQPAGSDVYLVDRPGSQQSIIFAGHLAPPKANPDEVAIVTMNDILGGSFSSRVNMNLREDKGWSYGAFSMVLDAEGPRPLLVYAPVQTDRTAESVGELRRELEGIVGERPVTPEELERSQASQTRSLPGRWETNAAVGSDLAEIVRFGLPHDYWDTYADAVRSLGVEQVRSVASNVLQPDRMVWVIVGDLAEIEEPVRALQLGPVHRIDADGRVVDGPRERP